MRRFLRKIFSDTSEPKEKPLVIIIDDIGSNKIHFVETDQAKNAHVIIVRIKVENQQNPKEELDQFLIHRENIKAQEGKETKKFARKACIGCITAAFLLEIVNAFLLFYGMEPNLFFPMSLILSRLWFWGGIMFNKMT